jgi:hypothetical protein
MGVEPHTSIPEAGLVAAVERRTARPFVKPYHASA